MLPFPRDYPHHIANTNKDQNEITRPTAMFTSNKMIYTFGFTIPFANKIIPIINAKINKLILVTVTIVSMVIGATYSR